MADGSGMGRFVGRPPRRAEGAFMKNPPLDLLKYCAFPEMAEALRARQDRIVLRWEQMVREVLPAAEELTLTQLRDHVPALLAQMAEALESDQPAATHELID